MSNGDDQQMNCVIEACCGEDKPKQARAMGLFLAHNFPDLTDGQVSAISKWLVATFDFAEVGTLYEFKESIIRLAKGKPFEG